MRVSLIILHLLELPVVFKGKNKLIIRDIFIHFVQRSS